MSTDHTSAWNDKGWATFNPSDVPVENLPVIYGFNNCGSPGWFMGVLLGEGAVERLNAIPLTKGHQP